ncbi:MAG TPA: adenylosuccinate synthetase [Methanothermobacter sp.]|nr:adenylosuccinate synthetase [Methanothermobacter sp. MT-2]HHW05044.1 adenylosuccinate synthetase [Methanothermobacter sp.]HOK72550.1 adenylosuccinate synthetase [Methanothermobacter sp.]HOL69387.1 adenylosuccinate synthetase [Methanothermobacter sp.]HPQ04037.1 adenylosuccinate synthetase [Methanothermobacter sp.]
MTCTVLVGGGWGDEGKGKCITYLCYHDKPSIIARAGVGPNAGHSVEFKGEKYALRLTPSGFVHRDAKLLIGAGVLIDPEVFLDEMENLSKYDVKDRTFIDYRCAIIEEKHKIQDRSSDYLSKKIGSTGTGCGPANAERVMRTAKLAHEIPELEDYLTDVPVEINKTLDEGSDVFIEGSQGFGLSLYYGTYPYVTSKDTTASTAAADVGVGPTRIDEVITVFKAYATRVGKGPFPTEISQEEAEKMGLEEYGTVTGRRRRIGLFDMDMARESCMINGATQIAVTCVDRLYPRCERVREYSKLSGEAKRFIEEIEDATGVPVTIISTGPDLEDTIDLRGELL